MTEVSHPVPQLRKAAFVGGLVGGVVGSIIVQLICCLLLHCHQLPVK